MKYAPRLFPVLILSLSSLLPGRLYGEDPRDALTFEADFARGADLTVGEPREARMLGGAAVVEGRLEVAGSGDDGVEYGLSLREYLDASKSSWGNTTLVGIFTLNETAAKARQTLFATGNSDIQPPIFDNQSGILLLANSDSAAWGPRLSLCHDWKSMDIGVENFKPMPGTTYFLAASWNDNGGETIDLRIYLRELSEGSESGAHFHSSAVPRISAGMSKVAEQIIALGQRVGNRKQESKELLNGNIRLFQIYNSFTDSQEDFSKLYDAVTARLK